MADQIKPPFVYFGNKQGIASRVWSYFGDARSYIEPFCGSAAVMLAAPDTVTQAVINDIDGFITNFYRAVRAQPDDVAELLGWPQNEIDLFARQLDMVRHRDRLEERLLVDPTYYNVEYAAWWAWGAASWFGQGWMTGKGAWTVRDGRLVKRKPTDRPHNEPGVNRQTPAMSSIRGVHRTNTRHNLVPYLRQIANALRHTTILCGDWTRPLTHAAVPRSGSVAVFLDPPYGEGNADYSKGGNADKSVAQDVWEYALERGEDERYRIIVAAYDDGRHVPANWRVWRWTGRKGYGRSEHRKRETLYISPHCLQSGLLI